MHRQWHSLKRREPGLHARIVRRSYRVFVVYLYGRVRWSLAYAKMHATDAAALTALLTAPLTKLNGSGVLTVKRPRSMAGRAFSSSFARISRIFSAASIR